MIYVDTSVALAQLLAEDRVPPEELWEETLVSSRLLEDEIWNRIHARNLARSHGEYVRALIARVALLQARASGPSQGVRAVSTPCTDLGRAAPRLDGVPPHAGVHTTLSSYDERMLVVARDLKFEIFDL